MKNIITKFNPAYIEDLLIAVSESDKIIGAIDKTLAHDATYLKKSIYPHRAFSLFLFDQFNRMVLQKRSSQKKAFPLVWSNTCCSHPLFYWEALNETPLFSVHQTSKFAIKRTKEELGEKLLLKPEDLNFAGKFLYKFIGTNGWGEHELDYVYVAKINDPVFQLNRDEVESIELVKRSEYESFCIAKKNEEQVFSPWYLGIIEHALKDIWDNVENNTLCKQSADSLKQLDKIIICKP